MPEHYHFLIVFSGSGYAEAAMSHVVAELELRGHSVELVSYSGTATQVARSMAERGWRGLRAAVKQVTGKLVGDDPLGLGRDERPVDAVIVTAPALLDATRGRGSIDSLRLGLMTDLVWTPEWTELEVDALLLAHPVFSELAIRRGWPKAALFEGDVPLPKSFCRALDVPALRERFGISAEKGPVLLVVAERVDDARLDRLVFQLKQMRQPIQPVFYFGDDRRAAEVLRRAASSYGLVARMFGLVDNLEEYYASCDMVLAEAGNPLIYPMLALDKPVVLIDADAATRPLAVFLREQASGVTIPDVLRLGSELDALLANAEELGRLRRGALELVDQKGAQRIADSLERAVQGKADLVGRQAHRQKLETAPVVSGGGAFELIGEAPVASPDRDGNERRTHSTASAIESQQLNPLSAARAKEEMAALIMLERDVDKRLAEATRSAGLWERRLDLARQANESDLIAEAERLVQAARSEETALFKELDRIRLQKEQLKRWAAGSALPTSSVQSEPSNEGKFRSMELNTELDQLKKRFRANNDEQP